MDYKLSWILALFALGVIYLIVTGIQLELTPKQYVINTYMYLLLGIIISSLVWTILDEYQIVNYENPITVMKFIGVAILSFISLFVVLATSKEAYIIKNTAWSVFMICIGLLTYLTYKINVREGNMKNVVISLISIVAVLSYIAYTQPLETFNSWGKPMLYILGTLIIVECLDLIFGDHKSINFVTRSKIYSWVCILLFSGFILYDTQKILYDANATTELCDSKSQIKCADYPVASLGLFLDIANLFSSLSIISR